MSAKPVNAATPAVDGTTVNIFEIMDRARSRPNLISMGLGDPDLATPAHIIAAAKRGHRPGADRTGAGNGSPRAAPGHRQQTGARQRRHRRSGDRGSGTTGGQEALFLVIQALIEPGDEVIMPDPRYTSYDEAIALAGGKIVLVPTTEEDAFDLDPDEVEKRLTPAPRSCSWSPQQPDSGHRHPAQYPAAWRRSRRSET